MKLIVYDFDDTIINGDSSARFYKYCLKRFPKILAAIPAQGKALRRYNSCVYTKEQTKSVFFSYLSHIENVENVVEAFWQKNVGSKIRKDDKTGRIIPESVKKGLLKEWYCEHVKNIPADYKTCVISASPDFIVRPMCEILGIDYIICTTMNPETGVISGKNCHSEEKPLRFRQMLEGEGISDAEIIEFYSDSYSDDPVARLAEKSYLVQKDKLIDWDVSQKDKEKKTFVKSLLKKR